MSETTYYQRNKDIILNRANSYYKNDKERLREQTRNKYREWSEEEKIKRENMEEADIKICQEKKQRLKEYRKFFLWD